MTPEAGLREPIPVVLVAPPPTTIVFSRVTWILLSIGAVLNALLTVLVLRVAFPTDALTKAQAIELRATVLHAIDPDQYPDPSQTPPPP